MYLLQFSRAFLSIDVISNNLIRQKYGIFPKFLLKNSLVNHHKVLTSNYFRPFSLSAWPAFLSTSTPVLFLQDTLIQIHGVTGLPWWSVIMLSTFALRSVVTLPLAIHQYQVFAKLENLKTEMSKLVPAIGREVSISARTKNWDLKTSERVFRLNVKHHYNNFILRDNCHPAKLILLVLVQVPTWVCFSASLRNICYMMPYQTSESLATRMQLQSEGALWFADLTVPDFFVLPIILGLLNLTIIEIAALRRIAPLSFFPKLLQNIARGTTLVITVAAALNPSCLSFYWVCSSFFGFWQNIFFLMPKVRRASKIPLAPSESANPFMNIWNNLQFKIKKKC